jgi:hypothetical protein
LTKVGKRSNSIGTLDAIYAEDTEAIRGTVDKYLNEMTRISKGTFMVISLLQDFIIQRLLKFFKPQNQEEEILN